MIVPIDQAGRIVLPRGVRRELAIKAGDRFKISIRGSSVTLTPKRSAAGFVRKGKALVFAAAGKERLTNDQVGHILEDAREGRERAGLLFAQR